ncbi:MAG: DUF2179 domain-containing protein [Lunatimonas sp.]|uniref:DUF2179 domain-containing protein n=1 Tax=Lunatimonas sp. TaxID=2060141 RepID=UPI00263B0435|nr:DUF2179 domain-containing protein [Lunatimonas sp.]MCC5935681.1 DUF2179 domain-containing protein [Lunatimonas sp.]
MQEYLSTFGISENVFTYVIMPLLIFLARIGDVSINTLRIVFVMSGKKYIAPIMGFFEAMIWLLAIGQIFQNINNPLSYIAYSGGFAMGIWVGMTIEEKLALGRVLVRVITPEPMPQLVEYMKEKEHRFTIVGAEGRYGRVQLLFTVLKRENLKDFVAKVKTVNEKAFYTIESVKRVSEDDFSMTEDRPNFAVRLLGKIRK